MTEHAMSSHKIDGCDYLPCVVELLGSSEESLHVDLNRTHLGDLEQVDAMGSRHLNYQSPRVRGRPQCAGGPRSRCPQWRGWTTSTGPKTSIPLNWTECRLPNRTEEDLEIEIDRDPIDTHENKPIIRLLMISFTW